jgi:membrane protease YdiL (CAAX protease family)
MNDNWRAPAAPGGNQSMASRIRSYITWNLADIGIGITGTLLLIFILATISQVLVANHYGDETPEAYVASFIATILWDLGFVALVLFLIRRKGAGAENLGLRDGITSPGQTMLWVIGGYVALYSTVVIYNVLVSVLGLHFLEPSEQLPSSVFDNNVVIALAGIAIVLCAPIAEEIFFRGFLFGGLTRYVPLWAAALLSGAVFSLAHANIGLIIPFTIVGAILALLYARTNSLVTNISVHLLFNLTSYLILVFFPDAR